VLLRVSANLRKKLSGFLWKTFPFTSAESWPWLAGLLMLLTFHAVHCGLLFHVCWLQFINYRSPLAVLTQAGR
jgi:hypothetical protein